MKVSELKEILKQYSDDADIQLNISDMGETIGIYNIYIDEEYEKDEALVICGSLEENMYFATHED